MPRTVFSTGVKGITHALLHGCHKLVDNTAIQVNTMAAALVKLPPGGMSAWGWQGLSFVKQQFPTLSSSANTRNSDSPWGRGVARTSLVFKALPGDSVGPQGGEVLI